MEQDLAVVERVRVSVAIMNKGFMLISVGLYMYLLRTFCALEEAVYLSRRLQLNRQ